jgi:methylthioribose-1-phosphate isomerase
MTPPHIAYEPGVLRLLDQSKLPETVDILELCDWQSVVRAISAMNVRGAPAIGIAGAYGLALAARTYAPAPDFLKEVTRAAHGLANARPTAVNLSWAVSRLLEDILTRFEAGEGSGAIAEATERSARKIHEDDVITCRRIGDAGSALIQPGSEVLTHCNTGSLATGGYGTALGVIRSAWRDGKLKRVLVGETRPLLQGARLTTWELKQDGIPHTLITDSMAAHFMRHRRVQAVVVGADRIARNGDVANKIGTYGLAVLARAHGIPFIVAAPLSSFDPDIATGESIVIEERDPHEVTYAGGAQISPDGTDAANPAFDVTPADHITAIATERGVIRPPFGDTVPAALDFRETAVAGS